MLAEVVVFGNVVWNAGIGGSEEDAAEGHAGNVLQNVGMLDGFSGGSCPRQRGRGRLPERRERQGGQGPESGRAER